MGTLNWRNVVAALSIVFSVPVFATQPASASNTSLVSQIAGRLAQAKGVRAQFTQTQTLSAMKQPLVSTGSLVFSVNAA